MRILLIIVFFFSTQLLFSQTELSEAIEKVKVGMSQEQALAFMGTPSNKYELAEGPNGTVEIWNYQKEGEIVHSIEFIGGKVERVIHDYEAYQKELKQLLEKNN